MENWISTADSMPAKHRSVLVSDGESVGIGEFRGNTHLGFPYWTIDEDIDVTHWMPLPKPPVQRKEGTT